MHCFAEFAVGALGAAISAPQWLPRAACEGRLPQLDAFPVSLAFQDCIHIDDVIKFKCNHSPAVERVLNGFTHVEKDDDL